MHQLTLRGGLIVGGALLVILICTTWLINSWREESRNVRAREPGAKGAEKGGAQPPNGIPVEPQPREDPAMQEERRARTQARLQAIRGLHKDISESVDKLEQELIAWETRMPELLKGNEGKRIAASKSRLEQIAVILEKPRATRPQAKAIREQLESLIKPINRAILEGSNSYLPSESLLSDFEKVGEENRIKLRDLREMKAIVDALQADSVGAEPAEKSLGTLIEEMQAQQLRARAEIIAKAKQDAFDRETRRLADAETKAEEDLANARLTLLKSKTDAARAKIEQDAANEKLQASLRAEEQKRLLAKKQLEAKFDQAYPKMQGFLVPFTAPGFKQVNGSAMVLVPDKGPVSFSKLRPFLKKETRVMEDLVLLMWYGNDRPKGAFPAWRAEVDQENVGRVQDFLTEYGEIMVDRKLLLP